MERNLIENRGLTREQTAHLRGEMDRAFPESSISGYEQLIDAMKNHEGDHHVLAAAIRGNAETIVTENLRHFPKAACDPYGIRPCSVGDFFCDLLSVDHERMCEVLRNLGTRPTRPSSRRHCSDSRYRGASVPARHLISPRYLSRRKCRTWKTFL
jgi:hypothetical protein